MAKPTPGFWETDLADHDAPYQNVVIRSGNRRIAEVWIDDAPVHDYNAEQLANAKLLAAAPRLLNAVRFLLGNPDNRISQADRNAAHDAIDSAVSAL